MNDEVKKYLADILLCIDRIEKFVGSERKFETYRTNEMIRQSVERNLENHWRSGESNFEKVSQ